MLVWILQTGEPLNCDGDNIRPMRAINLSKALISHGHKVEIISTRFFHQKKIFRNLYQFKNQKNGLVETLINSPGYKSNLSIFRLFDHHILFFNLLIHLLKKKEKPDLLFVGFPPIEWSLASLFFSKLKSIPLVLDVKDLWPDIFWDKEAISPFKKELIKFLFIPYRVYSSFIATFSDYITGPTKSISNFFKNNYENKFISRTLKIPSAETFASPIVPPREELMKKINFESKINPQKQLNILFIGSLMSIYDFQTVQSSLRILSSEKQNVHLFIAGKGGYEQKIKSIFNGLHNVHFLGWINREEAIKLSKKCHIALAPYQNIKNYQINLVNKYIDYMSLGLPVITPLEGVIELLIKNNEIGWHYNSNNSVDLAKILSYIISSPDEIIKRSKNAYQLFKNDYTYEVIYNNLVNKLEEIVECDYKFSKK